MSQDSYCPSNDLCQIFERVIVIKNYLKVNSEPIVDVPSTREECLKKNPLFGWKMSDFELYMIPSD